MNLYLDSFYWWSIVLLTLVGFYLLRFSFISHGASKEVIKSLGIIITGASFILMFFSFGLLNTILLLLLLWIAITPIVMILITHTEKKLFPYAHKKMQSDAEKMKMSVEKLRSLNDMNYMEAWKEIKKNNRSHNNISRVANGKKDKTWMTDIVDNLNRNVILDHIKYVESGTRDADEDYHRFIKIKDRIQTLEGYRQWKQESGKPKKHD